jgi:hypothetical protein
MIILKRSGGNLEIFAFFIIAVITSINLTGCWFILTQDPDANVNYFEIYPENFVLTQEPDANINHDVVYLEDMEFLVSQINNSKVAICGYTSDRNNSETELCLQLYIENNSQIQFNVTPEDIIATGYYEPRNNTSPRIIDLYVYSASEYLDLLEADIRKKKFARALAGFSVAYNSGLASSYPTQPQFMQNAVTGLLLMNAAKEKVKIASIEKMLTNTALLKKTTLFPDNEIYGKVMIECEYLDYYEIIVPIAGEEHKFRLIPKYKK